MGMIFKYQGYELRDIAMTDATELFERFTSQLRVMRYLPFKVHVSLHETEALIEGYLRLAEGGSTKIIAIRHTSADRLVGTIGASRHEHAVALAMKIAPDRFSMGAGCVIAPRFVHWLLAHDDIRRVWAYTDIANKGVINLLTHMGARCEGTVRKYAVHPNISLEPRDCLLWSMVR